MKTKTKVRINTIHFCSALALLGFLAPINMAMADINISCSASGGTNCPSPNNSISDLLPTAVSTITVPPGTCQAGTITDVNVNLNLNHTWVGDLHARLVHPGGTFSRLLRRPGRPNGGPGFGCSRNNVNATFDDAAGTAAENTCNNPNPAISGVVRPMGGAPLSIFNGGNGDGVWILRIRDAAGLDTGELIDWSLDIKCTPVAPVNVPIFSLWGLMSLIGLLGFGGRYVTRRKTKIEKY